MFTLVIFAQVAETPQESAEEIETYARYRYPTMSKTQGGFKLKVVEGEFTDSQIIVMLGENGTGKTTFIRMLVFFSTCLFSFSELQERHFNYNPCFNLTTTLIIVLIEPLNYCK